MFVSFAKGAFIKFKLTDESKSEPPAWAPPPLRLYFVEHILFAPILPSPQFNDIHHHHHHHYHQHHHHHHHHQHHHHLYHLPADRVSICICQDQLPLQTIQVFLLLDCRLQFVVIPFFNFLWFCLFEHIDDIDHLLRLRQELLQLLLLKMAINTVCVATWHTSVLSSVNWITLSWSSWLTLVTGMVYNMAGRAELLEWKSVLHWIRIRLL